ncbi:MAG: SET domain-containing protein [Parcubacteria group bacterium]|nr:SET domain-containing protein [Parcubacteria group bacterium]
MLLVKTKIGPSEIDSVGLFANQFIPKKTPIWKFQPGFDLKVDENKLTNLSEPAREQFLKYAYLNPKINKYVLCFDDARFFNHSDNPNCIDINSSDDEESIDLAVKDIYEGEELTCNYKKFDANFYYKMNIH